MSSPKYPDAESVELNLTRTSTHHEIPLAIDDEALELEYEEALDEDELAAEAVDPAQRRFGKHEIRQQQEFFRRLQSLPADSGALTWTAISLRMALEADSYNSAEIRARLEPILNDFCSAGLLRRSPPEKIRHWQKGRGEVYLLTDATQQHLDSLSLCPRSQAAWLINQHAAQQGLPPVYTGIYSRQDALFPTPPPHPRLAVLSEQFPTLACQAWTSEGRCSPTGQALPPWHAFNNQLEEAAWLADYCPTSARPYHCHLECQPNEGSRQIAFSLPDGSFVVPNPKVAEAARKIAANSLFLPRYGFESRQQLHDSLDHADLYLLESLIAQPGFAKLASPLLPLPAKSLNDFQWLAQLGLVTVVKEGVAFSPIGLEIIRDLRPWVYEMDVRSHWPKFKPPAASLPQGSCALSRTEIPSEPLPPSAAPFSPLLHQRWQQFLAQEVADFKAIFPANGSWAALPHQIPVFTSGHPTEARILLLEGRISDDNLIIRDDLLNQRPGSFYSVETTLRLAGRWHAALHKHAELSQEAMGFIAKHQNGWIDLPAAVPHVLIGHDECTVNKIHVDKTGSQVILSAAPENHGYSSIMQGKPMLDADALFFNQDAKDCREPDLILQILDQAQAIVARKAGIDTAIPHVEMSAFSRDQQHQIDLGQSADIDTSLYAHPHFNWVQMATLRTAIQKGIDVSSLADANIPAAEMIERIPSLAQAQLPEEANLALL